MSDNIAGGEELCQIHVKSLIKLFNHTLRFWKKKNRYEDNQCVYGFIIGRADTKTRLIKDIEPVLHYSTSDFEFKEKFKKDMSDLNKRYVEEESLDRIIGWYKSVKEPIKFKAMDVKNHLFFQGLNKNYIGLIFDPEIFSSSNEYGFSIYRLMEDSYGDINIMSEHLKIPWEILPLGDQKDSTISVMKDLIDSVIKNEKFITELDEY